MDEELTNIEVIVFEDDEGNEIEMDIVDEFDFEGKHIVALSEAPGQMDESEIDESEMDEEDTVSFFEVIKDKENEDYELIEDEKAVAKLADFLEERLLAR